MDIIQKRTGVKYHEGTYLPIASQMGLCTKGPTEEIRKNGNNTREKEI